MNFLLISVSVVAALSTVALFMAWKGAEAGYQDELGFHPGAQPLPATATAHGSHRVKSRQAHRRTVVL